MKTENIFAIIKGMIIGGTMLVPGVSGGSMAMILGIYTKLISAVNNIRTFKKETLLFLGLFIAGALSGMLIFAKPLLKLIEIYPKPTLYFFAGAVAGAIPMIYKQSEVKTFSIKHAVYIILGICGVLLLSVLPTDMVSSVSDNSPLWIFLLLLAGFISAIALILPGISVSYFLLLLGLYDETMLAISEINIAFLLPLGIGVIIGILLTTKILENAMTRYPQTTYLIILGFIIGSIIEVFPGIPNGLEWVRCLLTAAVGFEAIMLLSQVENTR